MTTHGRPESRADHRPDQVGRADPPLGGGPAAAAGDTGVHLGALTQRDLDRAARLHTAALPHGFLVSLGPQVLAHYYAQYPASPHGIALAARRGGELVGVLVGLTDRDAHRAWAARHHPSMARHVARGLVRHPELVLPFLRRRSLPYTRAALARVARRLGLRTHARPDERTAVLSHVHVDPAVRGLRVGSRLVERFTADAAAAGAPRADLLTKTGAQGAGAFYAHRGWHRTGETRTADGITFDVWRRRLDPPEPA